MRQERIRTYNDQQIRAMARQELAKGTPVKDAVRTARAKFAELQALRAQMPPPPLLDH